MSKQIQEAYIVAATRTPVGKAPPKRPDPPLAADGLIPTQYPHRMGWHTDQSYRRPPPDISLFYAVTPARRDTGQTLFANGILAYAALPAALRAKVDTLEGLHAQPGSGRSRDAALAGRKPRDFALHERSQRQPVRLALGDGQAIEMRAHAAFEHGVAIVIEMMCRNRRRERGDRPHRCRGRGAQPPAGRDVRLFSHTRAS